MNGCGRCCVDRQTAEIFAKTGGPPPIYRAVLTIQLKPGCRAVIGMRYSDPFARVRLIAGRDCHWSPYLRSLNNVLSQYCDAFHRFAVAYQLDGEPLHRSGLPARSYS